MPKDLKVIDDFYEATRYLMGRIEKFPRSHRYTLGWDMERRCQAILADFVRARYAPSGPGKRELLRGCNVELEVLRLQMRLARDLAALSVNSEHHALELIREVGCQLGGWIKTLPAGRS